MGHDEVCGRDRFRRPLRTVEKLGARALRSWTRVAVQPFLSCLLSGVMGLVGAPNVGESFLVEREDVLGAIDVALTRARVGRGVLLFIEGPAGIGKTGVLKAARERAWRAGMAVFSGLGAEFEREFPFGVMRQCLAPAVYRQENRERLLRGAASLAMPALMGADVSVEASSLGLLNGLYWLVAALGDERPALLLVDDAHWADEPSLRFLEYLARRIESLPAALIVAARTVVDFSSSPRALREVRDHARGDSAVYDLRPLSSAGVSELLAAARRGPIAESFADACRQTTGGNPFLLDALVRSLEEGGVQFGRATAERVAEISPPEVKSWVAGILGRLSPEARAVAHAVAVLGDAPGRHCDGASPPGEGSTRGEFPSAMARAGRARPRRKRRRRSAQRKAPTAGPPARGRLRRRGLRDATRGRSQARRRRSLRSRRRPCR